MSYKVAKLTNAQLDRLAQEVKDEILFLKENSDNFDPDLYEAFAENDNDLWEIAQAQLNARPTKPAAEPTPPSEPLPPKVEDKADKPKKTSKKTTAKPKKSAKPTKKPSEPAPAPKQRAKSNAASKAKLHYMKPLPDAMLEEAEEVKLGCEIVAIRATERTELNIPTVAEKGDVIVGVGHGDSFHPFGVAEKGKTVCKTLIDASESSNDVEGKTTEDRAESLSKHIEEIVKEDGEHLDNKAKAMLQEATEILNDDELSRAEVTEAAKIIDKVQDRIADEKDGDKPRHQRRKKPHPEMCSVEQITRKDNVLLTTVEGAIQAYESGDSDEQLIQVIYDKDDKQVMFVYASGLLRLRRYYDVCLSGTGTTKERDQKPKNFKVVLGKDAIDAMRKGNKTAYKQCRNAVMEFLKDCEDGCSDAEKEKYREATTDCKLYARKYLIYRQYMNWVHSEARKKYKAGKYSNYYQAYHEVVKELRAKHLKSLRKKEGVFGIRRTSKVSL